MKKIKHNDIKEFLSIFSDIYMKTNRVDYSETIKELSELNDRLKGIKFQDENFFKKKILLNVGGVVVEFPSLNSMVKNNLSSSSKSSILNREVSELLRSVSALLDRSKTKISNIMIEYDKDVKDSSTSALLNRLLSNEIKKSEFYTEIPNISKDELDSIFNDIKRVNLFNKGEIRDGYESFLKQKASLYQNILHYCNNYGYSIDVDILEAIKDKSSTEKVISSVYENLDLVPYLREESLKLKKGEIIHLVKLTNGEEFQVPDSSCGMLEDMWEFTRMNTNYFKSKLLQEKSVDSIVSDIYSDVKQKEEFDLNLSSIRKIFASKSIEIEEIAEHIKSLDIERFKLMIFYNSEKMKNIYNGKDYINDLTDKEKLDMDNIVWLKPLLKNRDHKLDLDFYFKGNSFADLIIGNNFDQEKIVNIFKKLDNFEKCFDSKKSKGDIEIEKKKLLYDGKENMFLLGYIFTNLDNLKEDEYLANSESFTEFKNSIDKEKSPNRVLVNTDFDNMSYLLKTDSRFKELEEQVVKDKIDNMMKLGNSNSNSDFLNEYNLALQSDTIYLFNYMEKNIENYGKVKEYLEEVNCKIPSLNAVVEIIGDITEKNNRMNYDKKVKVPINFDLCF